MSAPVGVVPRAKAPTSYRVARRTVESPGVATILLEPLASPLPTFAPGQFAMVYAYGIGDIPLSVSAIDGDRLSHTVRAVGAISTALYTMRTGRTVGVRGPFGTGWKLPDTAGFDVVVVAGGIGLAPLRPVIREVLAQPDRCGELNVLIGTRTPHDRLYTAEAKLWQEAGARVLVTVDRPDDASWTGDVGVVTTLLERAPFNPVTTVAFICGPEVMARHTARALLQRGIPAHQVHVALERTMHCGCGHCGHCQLGPLLLCRDGPVVPWNVAEPLLSVREL